MKRRSWSFRSWRIYQGFIGLSSNVSNVEITLLNRWFQIDNPKYSSEFVLLPHVMMCLASGW